MDFHTEKRNSEFNEEKMEISLIEKDLKAKEFGCLMDTGVQTEWKFFNIDIEKKDIEVQTESNFHETEHRVAKTHVEVQTVEMICEITNGFTSENTKEKEIMLDFLKEKAEKTFSREEKSSDFDTETTSLENNKEGNCFTANGINSEGMALECEKERGESDIDLKEINFEGEAVNEDSKPEKDSSGSENSEFEKEMIASVVEPDKIISEVEPDQIMDSDFDTEKTDCKTEKTNSDVGAEIINFEKQEEISRADGQKNEVGAQAETSEKETREDKTLPENCSKHKSKFADKEDDVKFLVNRGDNVPELNGNINTESDTEKIYTCSNKIKIDIIDNIDGESNTELINSEQDTEILVVDSEQGTEKIDPELEKVKIDPQLDTEKVNSEQDKEQIDSKLDIEKSDSEQGIEKSDSEQDAKKIDFEQDTEKIGAEQDTKKIDTEQNTKKIDSVQDGEKNDSELDTEKVDSEQGKEKNDSKQDTAKIDPEQEKGKIDPELDTEKVDSEQGKEKNDSKQDIEKIDSEQEKGKIDPEQETEKIDSEQDTEKIDSELDKEKIDSEQDTEKIDSEVKNNTSESKNIPENFSFTREADNIQFVQKLDKTVVIDAGSLTVKAGFAGDENPKACFPNIVGEPKKNIAISLQHTSQNNILLIAMKAECKVPVLKVRYPVVNGQIEEWDDMVEILCHAIEHEIDVDDVSQYVMVMITETEDGQQLMRLLFQIFKPRAVLLVNQAILSLFASGRSTGVVINFGEGTSQVVPIFNRCIIQHAVRNWGCNGLGLTKKLMEMLDIAETPAGLIRTRGIKEKFCYVASDPNIEKENIKCDECELSDGTEITIGAEKFQCPEVLFEDCRIHEIVVKVIESCDKDIQGELFKNIVLAGGSTMLPGFPERLEKEIRGLVGETKEFHIITPPDRNLSAWRGGSKISSTDLFLCDLYSKDEFDNKGPMHYF
ncbi:POTE ankyrin domain family member F-like [Saccostrea cucullata]|uniref:POTE ankyrin domain family member F-like n=1 Tax=Saccostrea cuccullata TaxID=36930 RepID=UPI002ED3FBBA